MKLRNILGELCLIAFLFSCTNNKNVPHGEYILKVKKDYNDVFNTKHSNLFYNENKSVFYFLNDSVVFYKYWDGHYNEPYYSVLSQKKLSNTKYVLSYNTYSLFKNYEITEISDKFLGKDSIRIIYQIDEPRGNLLSSIIINDTVVRYIRSEYPNEKFKLSENLKSIRIASFLKPALYTERYIVKESSTNTLYIKYKYFYTDRHVWPVDTNKFKFQNEIRLNETNYKGMDFSLFPNRKVTDTIEIKHGKVYYNNLELQENKSKKKLNISESDLFIFNKIQK